MTTSARRTAPLLVAAAAAAGAVVVGIVITPAAPASAAPTNTTNNAGSTTGDTTGITRFSPPNPISAFEPPDPCLSACSTLVERLNQLAGREQETQLSFNLQYLQLQNSMQNENRQFTEVSNILKAKIETERNSISNIR